MFDVKMRKAALAQETRLLLSPGYDIFVVSRPRHPVGHPLAAALDRSTRPVGFVAVATLRR
jgi:hypothetical protein